MTIHITTEPTQLHSFVGTQEEVEFIYNKLIALGWNMDNKPTEISTGLFSFTKTVVQLSNGFFNKDLNEALRHTKEKYEI